MQRGGDKSRNGKAVSKCDGKGIITGSFDRADTDKNQRECSDKFCQERAKFGHAWMQSNQSRAGNPRKPSGPLMGLIDDLGVLSARNESARNEERS